MLPNATVGSTKLSPAAVVVSDVPGGTKDAPSERATSYAVTVGTAVQVTVTSAPVVLAVADAAAGAESPVVPLWIADQSDCPTAVTVATR